VRSGDWLILLALLSGCQDADRAGRSRFAVVGGELDPHDPAVVMVMTPGGLCSGTVVSPRVVLTAAHCFSAGMATEVVFGPSEAEATRRLEVAEGEGHPSFDIDMMTLVEPASVAPIPMFGDDLVPNIGGPVRIVC
jgi:hypothetical protein